MRGDGCGFPGHADMIDAVAPFFDMTFDNGPGDFVVLIDEQPHVSHFGDFVIGDRGFSPINNFLL